MVGQGTEGDSLDQLTADKVEVPGLHLEDIQGDSLQAGRLVPQQEGTLDQQGSRAVSEV